MRGGQGRFNPCPSEAASLAALRAVLPAGLGWVAASAAAPQCRVAGGRSEPGGACPT